MRGRRTASVLAVLALFPGSLSWAEDEGRVPSRPERLRFPELALSVPDATELRHELDSGAVIYVAADHHIPLVDVVLAVGKGDEDDPHGLAGLASLTASMIRQGGTLNLSATDLDNRIDFLGAEMGAFAGGGRSGAYLSCTSQTLEQALPLFLEMVRDPGFQKDRLVLAKDRIGSRLSERNDDPLVVLEREWRLLLQGQDLAREIKPSDLEAIERSDLEAFHRHHWRGRTPVLAVSGAVEAEKILILLEEGLLAWGLDEASAPEAQGPAPVASPPGIYHVEHSTPQAKILLGHGGPQRRGWDDPDEMAILLLSEVLAGGGAVSRLRARLRAQEGLVYRAGGELSMGHGEPGELRIFLETDGAAVGRALEIVIQELHRLQKERVPDIELGLARDSLLSASSLLFESAKKTAGRFAEDELLGRPHAYWATYRSRLQAVGAGDVQRVARAYLKPEELVVLVVGQGADLEPQESALRRLAGAITRLPKRDPMTLEPVASQAPKITQVP